MAGDIRDTKFTFDEAFNASGGRFRGKVKIGRGATSGREFVTLELATQLEDREAAGVQAQMAANKTPWANLGTNINDVRALGELLRRMLKVADGIEEKLDAKAVETV